MAGEESIVFNVILLAAFLAVLDQASHMSVTGAIKISENTGLRASTVGFIFLALATSLPEVSISIASASTGQIGLAVGNIIGSNIANVSIVIGIPLIFLGIKRVKIKELFPRLEKTDLDNLFFGLMIASAVPLFLLLVQVSIAVGISLLSIFLLYSYYMSRVDITTKKFREEPVRGRMSKKVLYRSIVKTIIGVIAMILSAQVIVFTAGNIISSLGISQTILGATVVAVGTSLPELALSLRAINERRLGLAFGNIVGSNFANITLVLGSLIVIAPFQLDSNIFRDMIIFSLLANIILWYFLSIKWIEWKTGLILFSIYILFIASITPSIYV